MKTLRKLIAAATLMAVVTSAADLNADVCVDTGGCGYAESCCSPCLTPAIALGAIAIVAIIAVAVQNRHGGHGHDHND